MLDFPLCLNFALCLDLQYVGFEAATRDCGDFGEWRFRETFGQEDTEDFGQAMVAMCCTSVVRLLMSDVGNTMSPKFCFRYRVVPSSVDVS